MALRQLMAWNPCVANLSMAQEDMVTNTSPKRQRRVVGHFQHRRVQSVFFLIRLSCEFHACQSAEQPGAGAL